MKKKGLIISTIVMVVVLIAALTTSTYAWFSTSASTKVEQIDVKIAAASDIDIGVVSSANAWSADSNNYMFETPTFSATDNAYTVADGAPGLGSNLTLGNFNLATAVATTNSVVADETALQALTYDAGVNNSSFDPTKTIFAGNLDDGYTGTQVGKAKMSDATIAIANTDYIHLAMGARANKSSVYGIVLKITVTTVGSADTLLMNSALHLYIETDDTATGEDNAATKYADIDVWSGTYSTTNMGRTTTKSSVGSYTKSGVTYAYANSQASATIYVLIAGAMNTSGSAISTSIIFPFQIYGYVWGPDSDCVTNATGCECTIDMEFIAVNAANLAALPANGGLNGVATYVLNNVA